MHVVRGDNGVGQLRHLLSTVIVFGADPLLRRFCSARRRTDDCLPDGLLLAWHGCAAPGCTQPVSLAALLVSSSFCCMIAQTVRASIILLF
jgi:hypothetical protein